uniref:Uncharacterized protein n=1 Tax=Babesia bovis TaxID=5865 RepID=A7ASK7_BABBO|eukprot:XP_001611094.1 hypothetical protein [Babesia bovis T2Bo]
MTIAGNYPYYDKVADDDPFTSVVAAQGSNIVIGTLYGEIYLIAHGKKQLIATHSGQIVELQLRKCTEEYLDSYTYMICATSLGYIYIHLLCLADISRSRVIYKLRTGQRIRGLIVNPKFKLHNHSTSDAIKNQHVVKLPRRTYDLRSSFSGQDSPLDTSEYTSTIVFTTASGHIYRVEIDLLDKSDTPCTLIHNGRPSSKRIPIAWHGDMLAWADAEGTQIYLMPKHAMVAFLPHSPPLDQNLESPQVAREYTPLHELIDENDFYATSDESDLDMDELEPCSGIEYCTNKDRIKSHRVQPQMDLYCAETNAMVDPKANSSSIEVINVLDDPANARNNRYMNGTIAKNIAAPINLENNAVPMLFIESPDTMTDVSGDIAMLTDTNGYRTPMERHTFYDYVADGESVYCSIRSNKYINHMSDVIPDLQSDELVRTMDSVALRKSTSFLQKATTFDKNRLSGAIKTHCVGFSKPVHRELQLPELGVVLCWISKLKLLVGIKNLCRIVDVLPACVEGMEDVHRNRRMKLLDIENMKKRYTNKVLPHYVTIVQPKTTVDAPLRGRVSYTLTAPIGCHVSSVVRQSAKGTFSVFYTTPPDPVEKTVKHTKVGHERSTFSLEKSRDETDNRALISGVDQVGTTSKYTFYSFDPCYNKVYINHSFVYGLGKHRNVSQQVIIQITCKLDRSNLEFLRSIRIVCNHFRCNDIGHFGHCLSAMDKPKVRLCDAPFDHLIAAKNSMFFHCYADIESFQGLCMVANGSILTVKEAHLEQHVMQSCEHGNYEQVICELIAQLGLDNENKWDYGLHNVVLQSVEAMLSSTYVNIDKLKAVAVRYIHYSSNHRDLSALQQQMQDLVALFAKHKRLNVLLGYIVQGCMKEFMKAHTILRSVIINCVLASVEPHMPFVLLRLVVTENLDASQTQRVFEMLKLCLKGYYPSGTLPQMITVPLSTQEREVTVSLDTFSGYCKVIIDRKIKPRSYMELDCYPKRSNMQDNITFPQCTQSRSSVSRDVGTSKYLDCSTYRYSQIYINESKGDILHMLEQELESVSIPTTLPPTQYEWSHDVTSDYALFTQLMQLDDGSIYQPWIIFSPGARACMMAVAAILLRIGQMKKGFVFMLHAQSKSALKLAEVLTDTDHTFHQEVINAVIELYTIDPEMTEDLLIQKYNTPNDVKELVAKLTTKPKLLHSYLKGIHSEAKLPDEYLELYIKLVAVFDKMALFPLIKEYSTNAKRRYDLIPLMAKLRLCNMDYYNTSTLSQEYKTEAFIAWICGLPWEVFYNTVILASRLQLIGVPRNVLEIHKTLLNLIYQVIPLEEAREVFYKLTKYCSNAWQTKSGNILGAVKLTLYNLQHDHKMLNEQHGMYRYSYVHLAKQRLNVITKGVLFYPNIGIENSPLKATVTDRYGTSPKDSDDVRTNTERCTPTHDDCTTAEITSYDILPMWTYGTRILPNQGCQHCIKRSGPLEEWN